MLTETQSLSTRNRRSFHSFTVFLVMLRLLPPVPGIFAPHVSAPVTPRCGTAVDKRRKEFILKAGTHFHSLTQTHMSIPTHTLSTSAKAHQPSLQIYGAVSDLPVGDSLGCIFHISYFTLWLLYLDHQPTKSNTETLPDLDSLTCSNVRSLRNVTLILLVLPPHTA